uniref:C2H2-type domain-containing protein n=1 Tax=Monopterus albus TaxID=43700 RepID=A0A3Q3J4E7_MONAL
MEALHSRLTTGEQSGGQEHCQSESPHRGLQSKSSSQPRPQQQLGKTGSPKPHGTPQPRKQSRRQNPERKRFRSQRQSIDSNTVPEHKHETTTATKATTDSSLSPGALPSSAGGLTQSKPEIQEGTPKQKQERRPQRPGKYVCTYCGRACAKPSVLQKHIRSHTGERPYPCAPCGFSFKTKSNLYKHRKSHTHKVKAGLALGEPRSLEEQVTESEDETRQLSSASSHTERQGNVVAITSYETDRSKDCPAGKDDSFAVKKRLALRLSRGKQGLSDENTSSQILGSKGSTESGYFSHSESTEQSQDSPPNTSAKSYAEIILGKYGRLEHLQRMSRHHNQQPSGQEDKSIPFTVPKKQVIEHITKLITINEAVVDTSKIDSVKPRRFSLSRKNSSESQKGLTMKEPLIPSPKAGDLGYKTSGSITMGVPCEKFHHPSLNVEQPAGQTSTASLVRSHSMPFTASSFDVSTGGPSKFRLSQSFDERQPLEKQSSRRYGMLRRQPAIEIPLGADFTEEEHECSHSFYPDSVTTVPDYKQSRTQPYKCETCGTAYKDWEGYKKHKTSLCLAHHTRNEVVSNPTESSQLINNAIRVGASAMRKRRKEESFEFDDPSSPPLAFPALLPGNSRDETHVAYEGCRRPTLQTCSVIQHTSSFEKQEPLNNENQGTEATKDSALHEEYQLITQKQPQLQSTKLATRKLVRQHDVQVPEILVTEDSNMSTETSVELTSTAKPPEKPDEFQWPQRSPSLAQLPIEKLPPKKKRLRLAEAAQSSGESSFDSVSLPRSPSQDSSASYASSRSTSFEESNRPDMEIASSAPLRRSRAPHMLTVPGVHQHREMRRSASEQAPHDPQPSVLMTESRSKSFDYSCLSPERSAVGWRERRKCLLMRHTAIRDPDEEEQCTILSHSPEHVAPSTSSQASPCSVYSSRVPTSPLSGDTVLHNPVRSQCNEMTSQWKPSQNIQLTGSTDLSFACGSSIHPVTKKASHIHTGQLPPKTSQSYPTHGPSGAARARYLPMSRGLKLEIPSQHGDYSEGGVSHSHIQQSVPHITSSLELLRPVPSPSVVVRLQMETLTPACAIYTTLSQSTSPKPQEAVAAVSHDIGIATAEFGSANLHLWADNGPKLTGSGGNKRMLSPSNSIEFPPESQQQQKRVKEEDREVGCVDKSSVDTCNQKLKQEDQSCLANVCSPVTHVGPSFPSLLSNTCNSWCYLNYIKPSPSTLDEQKPSVYSSWSTTGYDPNPPGLSSKMALSLLHCKQRLSPSIYTISPMSVRTSDSMKQEDNRGPCSTEVYSNQSDSRHHEGTRKRQQSGDDNRSNRKEEKEKEEEDVHSCSRNKQPPQVWLSKERSNEKHGVVHSGGGGRCQCEDCGMHVKTTSALQKCTLHSPESPDCKHCNVTFKGDCEDQSVHPVKPKGHQYSELGKGPDEEDSHTNNKDGRCDESTRPKVAESSHAASSGSEKPHLGEQLMAPEPSQSLLLTSKDSTQKSSASTRRALFARRRLDASTLVSFRESHSHSPQSQTPRREPSPPRSLSPRPPQSPAPSSCFSPSTCHVSTSPLRPGSPVRGLSPIIVQPQESGSSRPPGCLADTSAQCQTCLHPAELPSTARLFVDEVGLTHITPNPTRLRGAHNLLSHLPLHSQQLGRASSQLIPIGGIHMIQPRSPLPLYNLHQDTLKEPSPSSRASSPDPDALGATSRSSQSDALSHRNNEGFDVQQVSSLGTETRHLEGRTGAHVREGCLNPETTQGQKQAPPS